jgi:hypothetical protein
MTNESPYRGLPGEAFWREGVVNASPFVLPGLYREKWRIPEGASFATAGSCFAQNITAHLKARKLNFLDFETPSWRLPAELHKTFGYSLYSARYGNIYTARQLLQLLQEAAGLRSPGEIVWKAGNKFHDALRPGVEPEGLDSAAEVLDHRAYHLGRVLLMFRTADIFIFTFGLTEGWVDKASGTVFPTAPGTIAGTFDADAHAFRNFEFNEIWEDFVAFRRLALRVRDGRPMRMILTVSPVPLTATAAGQHVLLSNTYSKSVLRAVAEQLARDHDDIDYFPSFEIMTNPASRGVFFESNLLSVSATGVEIAMKMFFEAHGGAAPPAQAATPADSPCEEAMLEAFA